jgi:hypothetical protein
MNIFRIFSRDGVGLIAVPFTAHKWTFEGLAFYFCNKDISYRSNFGAGRMFIDLRNIQLKG